MDDVDIIAGRGGCAYSQKSGVMIIDEKLFNDTSLDLGGSDHPAKLGVMIAYSLSKKFNKAAYTLNPTNIDELDSLARVTGIKGVYRRAQTHALNQKAIAQIHANKIGMKYEEASFIVCHIDGGITISAHKNGKMIDGTVGAGGDGPFTPTRIGSVPVTELLKLLETKSKEEVLAMCSRSGGFVSYFGTSNADTVHKMVEVGDVQAVRVWNSMIYQICKSIGAMACVLEGKIDGILLTGGLVRFKDIVEGIQKRCSFLGKISCYPGEVEQETLAQGVLDVFNGKITPAKYTGVPVFNGF
jgi:butyrate kinase